MRMQMMDKVFEILNLLKKDKEIQEFLSLKESLKQDQELNQLLVKLKSLDSKYCEEYLEIKKTILTMDQVKQYKKIENELYFLSLAINQKLKTISSKKSCEL